MQNLMNGLIWSTAILFLNDLKYGNFNKLTLESGILAEFYLPTIVIVHLNGVIMAYYGEMFVKLLQMPDKIVLPTGIYMRKWGDNITRT